MIAERIAAIYDRIDAGPLAPVWIYLVPREVSLARARELEDSALPLRGVPFAIKDNIDLAGLPTTAGCPAYAYSPERSATVVAKLIEAGAILIGKTNMDQFATGLVGTRSPHGACSSIYDQRYISGGSSSGSAVAVAAGLVSFGLGTDTAGSGRVPAAFNNLVGLKPTRGLISAAGVVPACKSLDCVSVFTLTCADAQRIFRITAGHDAADSYSRDSADLPKQPVIPAKSRFGVPRDEQLEFFGNSNVQTLYRAAVERLVSLGGTAVTVDYAPFAKAARLLYEGPWLAERLAGIKSFYSRQPEALLDVTRGIIARGGDLDAVGAFEAMYALQAIRQETRAASQAMDFLLLPTAGTIYTLEQVEADPIRLKTNLGYYTNFVNLLDLCALAVPAGFGGDGLPAGGTLVVPTGLDENLLRIGGEFQRATGLSPGATGHPLPATEEGAAVEPRADEIAIAVLGAHLEG